MHLIKDENGNLVQHGHGHTHEHTHEDGMTHTHEHTHGEGHDHGHSHTDHACDTAHCGSCELLADANLQEQFSAAMQTVMESYSAQISQALQSQLSTMSIMLRNWIRWLITLPRWEWMQHVRLLRKLLQIFRKAI